MGESLSFADYLDDLRRTARELRDDVSVTVAVSARLCAEAQAIRERRSRGGPLGGLVGADLALDAPGEPLEASCGYAVRVGHGGRESANVPPELTSARA